MVFIWFHLVYLVSYLVYAPLLFLPPPGGFLATTSGKPWLPPREIPGSRLPVSFSTAPHGSLVTKSREPWRPPRGSPGCHLVEWGSTIREHIYRRGVHKPQKPSRKRGNPQQVSHKHSPYSFCFVVERSIVRSYNAYEHLTHNTNVFHGSHVCLTLCNIMKPFASSPQGEEHHDTSLVYNFCVNTYSSRSSLRSMPGLKQRRPTTPTPAKTPQAVFVDVNAGSAGAGNARSLAIVYGRACRQSYSRCRVSH